MRCQRRRHPFGPRRRRWSDRGDFSFADRRCGDKSDQRLVLIVEHRGLDLAELGLQDILNGLCLDAVSAHLELCVDAAEEVDALRFNVDPAFVTSAVQTAELRVGNEFLRGLFRQVAVPTRNMDPSDTEFSNFPVGQGTQLIDLQDDVSDIGER